MTELRLHPRIPTQLMADISNDTGQQLNIRIQNLSPGGLMLEAGPDVKTLIFEGHDPGKDPLYHPVEISIRIQLPGQQLSFVSRARLLYIRRLSQYQYNFGFRFVAISAIHAQMMEQYIFGSESTQDAANSSLRSL